MIETPFFASEGGGRKKIVSRLDKKDFYVIMMSKRGAIGECGSCVAASGKERLPQGAAAEK